MRKVLIATLLATVTLSLAGCTSGTQSTTVVVESSATPASSPTPVSSPTPAVSIDAELLCHTQIAADTNVTGTTVIQHQAWGPTTIIVCGKVGGSFESGIENAGVLAVDNTGSVKWWTSSRDDHVMYELADPATDASGNIFVLYNPGRNNGVMILRPTADDIEVLAASYGAYLEQKSPLYFYSAGLVGPGSDGLYQIRQYEDNCGIICTSDTDPHTTYVWDGTTYVEQ